MEDQRLNLSFSLLNIPKIRLSANRNTGQIISNYSRGSKISSDENLSSKLDLNIPNIVVNDGLGSTISINTLESRFDIGSPEPFDPNDTSRKSSIISVQTRSK